MSQISGDAALSLLLAELHAELGCDICLHNRELCRPTVGGCFEYLHVVGVKATFCMLL